MERLADTIESLWHEQLDLSPYNLPEDLGYVEGALEGERLVIENHCYQTPQFRKLHLELAKVGSGLDILHCVMFPHPTYALPMFGADLVGRSSGRINAAIVDLSPIAGDRSLPAGYETALHNAVKPDFAEPRELPAWGDIFSQHCIFVRPQGEAEDQAFIDWVRTVLTLHCHQARQASPLTAAEDIAAVVAGQQNYCAKQQKNDKTRRILEKSFGLDWTERYMTTMLFDTVTV